MDTWGINSVLVKQQKWWVKQPSASEVRNAVVLWDQQHFIPIMFPFFVLQLATNGHTSCNFSLNKRAERMGKAAFHIRSQQWGRTIGSTAFHTIYVSVSWPPTQNYTISVILWTANVHINYKMSPKMVAEMIGRAAFHAGSMKSEECRCIM